MTVLVTGAAGFIGFHLSSRLLERGTAVLGFDNMNPYYDPALKRARLKQLQATSERTGTSFQLIEADLEDRAAMEAAFATHKPTKVVNLAAQAGCATRSKTRRPISRATWWALATSLRAAATTASNTWCMPPAAACTAATQICRFLNIKGLIIP